MILAQAGIFARFFFPFGAFVTFWKSQDCSKGIDDGYAAKAFAADN